jgi:hypothetical protein
VVSRNERYNGTWAFEAIVDDPVDPPRRGLSLLIYVLHSSFFL